MLLVLPKQKGPQNQPNLPNLCPSNQKVFHSTILSWPVHPHYNTMMLIRQRGFRYFSHANRLKQWQNLHEHLNITVESINEKKKPNSIAIQVNEWQYEHGLAGVTTPQQVLVQYMEQMKREGKSSSNIQFPVLCARNNQYKSLELTEPLQESCELQFESFDSPEAQKMFWHSAAHVLGQALEKKYGDDVYLCDGPALKDGGFFYEFYLNNKTTVSSSDFKDIEKLIKQIVKERQPFERMEVSKDEARSIFNYSKYKMKMLEKIPEGEKIGVYRCGPFIDLCRGPHVPHTGVLSSFKLTHCGASHWDGQEKNDELFQRVYGIAFPDKKQMKEWVYLQEEAKKRDHRIIGKNQGLFMFHAMSPGSSFMLPHGTRIFNRLGDFIRKQYKQRNYDEVVTPLLYKKDLWETSGHLENYKEDMYAVTPGMEGHDVGCGSHNNEEDHFGLKPMNCPGHCLIFRDAKTYSYRELPVRLADFSALHRNEASGALSGLTRVRRFHQDDAHIFCTPDQVQTEIQDCLEFIQHVYGIFGFEFQLYLSTRPEKYMGELELWDDAEGQLKSALEKFDKPFEIKEKDGAFYGPKIDIEVTDALKRKHQCATIQLDFQLPRRFNLKYDGSDGKEHVPIIIHRAVLGSIERIMAILIEHTAGKWPLWLSPRQVSIIPISEDQTEYANDIYELMKSKDMYADIQSTEKTLNKRVRESQLKGYNYILVIGKTEQENNQVNIRTRDNVVHGVEDIHVFINKLEESIKRFE